VEQRLHRRAPGALYFPRRNEQVGVQVVAAQVEVESNPLKQFIKF
jgi:hypothetical protein